MWYDFTVCKIPRISKSGEIERKQQVRGKERENWGVMESFGDKRRQRLHITEMVLVPSNCTP